jgi:hypothetical protein
MQYFYDGQIRRYLTQIVRAFSNFNYKDGDGELRAVPVMYGDLTRQVASIIRDNSENKIPSAPRMSVYITGLQMDRARLSDSSYVSKINLREKTFDPATNSYLNEQAKGYTVERLHPTPYTLSVNVDVWSTSTDQKLQILEQIFMLFNPDLEFQTTDNYVDWTSLSVLQLENINFSSRNIPVGTESEIDVSTLGFTAPIYISPPVKVKKLGVITDIITSIFNPDTGTISLDGFNPSSVSDTAAAQGTVVLPDGTVINNNVLPNGSVISDAGSVAISTVNTTSGALDLSNPLLTSYRNFDIIVQDETAVLARNKKLRVGEISWLNILEAELPAKYQPNISEIRLRRAELLNEIVGYFSIPSNDLFTMQISWDEDTLPANTLIPGPARAAGQLGTIDKIVNPLQFNPTTTKTAGTRLLLTGPIGYMVERSFKVTEKSTRIDTDIDYFINSTIPGRQNETVINHTVFVNGIPVTSSATNIDDKYVINLNAVPDIDAIVRYELNLNEDGAEAWKNGNGTDFLADANDIVEYDGTNWSVVFDASETTTTTYTTNLTTGQQYYWNTYYWQLSVDGYYPKGTWAIIL